MAGTREVDAFKLVIGVYEKKLREGRGMADTLEMDLEDQREDNRKIEEFLDDFLRADAREFSEKGPYFDAPSIPQAVKMHLKRSQPSTTKQIAAGLLEGGFQTSSDKFERATYTALNRLREKGKVMREDKLWRLSRVTPSAQGEGEEAASQSQSR